MKTIERREGELIYKLKGVAIICVIFAHCGNRISLSTIDIFLDQIRNNIAFVGVPLFFLTSGYLFDNEKTLGGFWERKLVTTVIPWFFWGTFVWAYEVIRKGLGYARILEWLFGIGTYLWFMRTIIIFWALMFFIKDKRAKMAVFIVSATCRIIVYDIFKINIPNVVFDCIALHLPFFSFGVVMREVNLLKKNINYNKFLFYSLICISLALLANKHQMRYYSPLYFIYLAGCIVVILYFLLKYENVQYIQNKLMYLGKNSFTIYLIHMPFAGLISNLFSRNSILLYFVLLQPIIVLFVLEYVIKLLQWISSKYIWVSTITGIKASESYSSKI